MPTADHSSPPLINYDPGKQIHVCHSSRMQNQAADLGTMQLMESRSLFPMSGMQNMLNVYGTCNLSNRFKSDQIKDAASC